MFRGKKPAEALGAALFYPLSFPPIEETLDQPMPIDIPAKAKVEHECSIPRSNPLSRKNQNLH
jgi:hypothetical protein